MNCHRILFAFMSFGLAFILGCADNNKDSGKKDGKITASSVKSEGQYFFIEEPKLFGKPVVANNSSYTARYICQLYNKFPPEFGVGLKLRYLDKPVDGFYMDNNSDSELTNIVYYSQDVILSEMYCLNYL